MSYNLTGLKIAGSSSVTSTIINTSSVSLVNALTVSVPVNKGKLYLVLGSIAVSCDTANITVRSILYYDGGATGIARRSTTSHTSTSGIDNSMELITAVSPTSSGTKNFEIRWSVFDAAGTAYSEQRSLQILEINKE